MKYILILIISLFFARVFASTDCDCPNSSNKIKYIQDAIDKKQYDSIPYYIDQLPSKDITCKQQALLCYLQYYITKDGFLTADSISDLLNKSIKVKYCTAIAAGFNFQMGLLYIKKNKSDSALTYLLKACDLSLASKDNILMAKSLGRIAHVFDRFSDQPEKSLEYIRKAIFVAKKTQDYDLQLLLMGSQSAYFGRMFDLFENKKYLDSALNNSLIALQLGKKLKNSRAIGQACTIITGVLMLKKDNQKAILYCDSGISALNHKTDFRYLRSLFYKKCDIYLNLKDYKKASQFADSSLRYANLENNILDVIPVWERLYEIDTISGNYKRAVFFHEKIMHINDSLKSIEQSEVTTELEQKYNKVQNEKTINELNQEKEISQLRIQFLVAGVLSAILIILIIVIFYRQSLVKNKFKTLEIEQRLNRARMNPHFFFNALASLQALSMEEKKSKEVSEYIHRFSKIMRESLESTFNELNTIENEVEFLTHYLELQKLRSDNKFVYRFNMDDDIEIDALLIPGMILQPFIENSIEHGFSSIESGGLITIAFSLSGDLLKVVIEDNGSGFKENDKHKTYPSRATQIIKDRLYLLNQTYKTNAIFELVNLPNNSGTKVEIHLPIIPKN